MTTVESCATQSLLPLSPSIPSWILIMLITGIIFIIVGIYLRRKAKPKAL